MCVIGVCCRDRLTSALLVDLHVSSDVFVTETEMISVLPKLKLKDVKS